MLADSQKISRVLTGKPFGDGSDGAYSSATIPTMTVEGCSGSAAGTTLTADGTTISDGDVVLIHQSRGTGAGLWEINKIASGGGSVNLVTVEDLANTYTDSGNSEAQVTKILQYTDVTVESGTWTVPNWGGNTGGILTFACNGTFTATGAIDAAGNAGGSGAGDGSAGVGCGFRGGVGKQGQVASYYGEGTTGASATSSSGTANGNGGGGSKANGDSNNGAAGAGGGNGVAGTNGLPTASYQYFGLGGVVKGAATLTTMVFGGGGGGGANGATEDPGAGGGGGGGGIVAIFANEIDINGTIDLRGGASTFAYRLGGGGAGGSCIIECASGDIGTGKILAAGATSNCTNAGAGRIAIHHSGAVTGTSTPTFSDTEDLTLVEAASGGAFLLSQFV